MAMTLGGRAAEEIVFGEITTGASNDLEKVTQTAKQMVMRFGMSDKLGPRVFGHDHGMPFLGREFSAEPDYSDEIAREIDDEIRRIVEGAHQQAKDILTERRESLEKISQILVKRETIEKTEFAALLAGSTEEEVFGPDEPAGPELPLPPTQPDRQRDKPRPLPRPGLAGGAAEAARARQPRKARAGLTASRRAWLGPRGSPCPARLHPCVPSQPRRAARQSPLLKVFWVRADEPAWVRRPGWCCWPLRCSPTPPWR